MSGPTPGPWEWEFPEYGPFEAGANHHKRAGRHFSLNHPDPLNDDLGECVLCSAPYGNLGGGAHIPSDADARLIAAAPALLSALEAADAALLYHPGGDNRAEDDIEAARAAFALAKRETP